MACALVHSHGTRRQRRQDSFFHPQLLQLEDRTVPTVTLLSSNSGMVNTGWNPPDPSLAAGPNHIVETVNESYAIYAKSTGTLVSKTALTSLFTGLDTTGGEFDPCVMYDDQAGRFVIESQVDDSANHRSYVDIAVSNSSDPTQGFTTRQIEVDEGGQYWTDNGKLGYNADAYVFTGNLYTFANAYAHEAVVTINKGTLASQLVDRGGNFSMVPARMHGSVAGGPMWFSESSPGNSNSVDIVRMDNVLSSTPSFTDYNLVVNSYSYPPAAPQPGGTTVDTGDCRTLNVEWSNNYLAAAWNSASGSDAAGAWFEFTTSGSAPVILQQGVIHPGNGVATYYPSVGVDAAGDLAVTYMESSSSEYPSVSVTGRLASDPAGTLEPPQQAKAGSNTLAGRGGDYSGISLDPSAANTFWIGNEYGQSDVAWATWLAQIQIASSSGSDTPPTIATPASASPNPVSGTTTNLSVLGADDTGESTLTYNWSVTSVPTGATLPSFSANGTNAAKNTTATVYQAGSYTLQVTITDPASLTVTSSVIVTVNATLTRIAVSPPTATLPNSATQQFTASALDQFGKAMATQPAFTWSLQAGGIGSVSSSGLYTAPAAGTGNATVAAGTGTMSGTATVTVASIPAAPTSLTATAVSAHQVNLAWTESSTNATGFNIQRSANGGTSWNQIAQLAGTVTSYSDQTVNKSKTYEYRVNAYDAAGTSAWSNVATVTTPTRAPVQYPPPDVPEFTSLSTPVPSRSEYSVPIQLYAAIDRLMTGLAGETAPQAPDFGQSGGAKFADAHVHLPSSAALGPSSSTYQVARDIVTRGRLKYADPLAVKDELFDGKSTATF
jgi:hypothetical protein